MVHNTIDAEQPTADRAADVARFDGDAVSIIKRERKLVQPHEVIDGDIIQRGYVTHVEMDSTGLSIYRHATDVGKVVGAPWASGSVNMATVQNVFGEHEIRDLGEFEHYGGISVRRAV